MKTITGTVTSTKMDKTVVVRVERKFRHTMYKKVITRHRKFKAHNELKDVKLGDLVEIASVRPISKTKFYKVVSKVA